MKTFGEYIGNWVYEQYGGRDCQFCEVIEKHKADVGLCVLASYKTHSGVNVHESEAIKYTVLGAIDVLGAALLDFKQENDVEEYSEPHARVVREIGELVYDALPRHTKLDMTLGYDSALIQDYKDIQQGEAERKEHEFLHSAGRLG